MTRKNSMLGPHARFNVFLMMAVFISELAVAELLNYTYIRLGTTWACLLDATILSFFFAFPLWFILLEPLFAEDIALGRIQPRVPWLILLKAVAVIFLAEFIIMYALAVVFPEADSTARNVADAGLTSFFVTLFIWQLLPPGKRLQIDSLNNLLNAPVKLFVILVVAVFMVDFLELPLEFLVSAYTSQFTGKLADAFLSTLLLSPLLWLLVIRPLRRTALCEKSYSDAIRDQVVEAIVTINSTGNIEAFNPAAEEIFGYRKEEIIGNPVDILLCDDLLSPAELSRIEEATTQQKAFRTGREVTCRRQDNSPLTLEISVSRVVIDGREQFLVFMRDISGRMEMEKAVRQSEARFRQLFEQSEDAIIFCKPGTSTVIDANQTAELLFGFTREELKDEGIECLCKPEEAAKFTGIIRNIGGQVMSQVDNFVLRRKDDTEVIVSVRGKIINIQGVELTFCSFRDITERVRMEEGSRNIQAKLIQANKMTSLGLLVSGVAHEINNPNNFIMANSQLLDRAWQDAMKILREYYRENGDFQIGGMPFSVFGDNLQNLFAGITDGSRRINEIVNNLKDYVRADRIPMAQEISVNQVVTAAVNILHYQLIKHTDRFHLDLQEDIPSVKGSSQQLVQVVTNLVMNACQAISGKDCGIWVTTSFDKVSGQVLIIVRDEGHGMPETISSRVMEPFFTTKLDVGGTGLGLFITQSIIKDHGGSLEFTSEPGRGTTFTAKIPAAGTAEEGHTS